jgi:DNA polymerase-4
MRAVTRSLTLPASIAATAILAEIAEELVRGVLSDHAGERTISLLAISVSNLDCQPALQLELPLGLADEKRLPGAARGGARFSADRALDRIRERFGWEAAGYGSVALGIARSVPDGFRELAERLCFFRWRAAGRVIAGHPIRPRGFPFSPPQRQAPRLMAPCW